MKRAITIRITAPALIPAFFLLRRRGTGESVRVVMVVRVRVEVAIIYLLSSLADLFIFCLDYKRERELPVGGIS
jgi:hypothetical protein